MKRRSIMSCLVPIVLSIGCGTSAEVDPGNPTTEPSCPSSCALEPPSGWDGPALLWSGPGASAPACPADAPKLLYEGHADLAAPGACTPCTCEPSAGTCGLMTTITLYMSETACMPSPMAISFDPPPNWDGSCSADDSTPKDTYNTVTFGPLQRSDDKCAPTSSIPEFVGPKPEWSTVASACGIDGSQCERGNSCIREDRDPDGRLVCVFREGLHECPADYPSQHVFYDGIDDQRTCSTCECGPVEGSYCLTMVRLYEDNACQDSLLGMSVWSEGPATACTLSSDPFPAPWPWPVGSKSAEPPTYHPGTCTASGGEPIGAAMPTGPTTFCCREAP